MTKKEKCCICNLEIEGYGNNPHPIKNEGRCCDECNGSQVVPARIELTRILRKYGTNERNLS
tara:strand:- start:426 stop:611 length:186 start_codon:yes stop_codon:yes gene_type:complete